MIRFLADDHFYGRILRGLFRTRERLDVTRAQDTGLSGASDEKLLEWAADNNRLILTHDKRTMPRFVHERLDSGLHTSGVFIVKTRASIGRCINDIRLIAECSEDAEWQDQIVYLPFE
jgi:hypothetical protein